MLCPLPGLKGGGGGLSGVSVVAMISYIQAMSFNSCSHDIIQLCSDAATPFHDKTAKKCKYTHILSQRSPQMHMSQEGHQRLSGVQLALLLPNGMK